MHGDGKNRVEVVIIFSLIRFLFIKIVKIIFLEKNRNEINSNRPISVWFSYFRTKPGQTD
jgi:hypothetical protein